MRTAGEAARASANGKSAIVTLLWPWALISLLPITAAAVWALRRPLHQLVPVGSLRLWRQAVDELGRAARRARRVSAAWVVLLAGAVLAAAALARPAWYAEAPARSIALAVYPAAELSAELDGPLGEFFARLDSADRVRLILPAVLGGPGSPLSRDQAARQARALRRLPAAADSLVLPDALGDAQHLYRFAPATLGLDDGPRATTITLPARPGEVTIDAFAVAPVPAPAGQVEVFLALRNHAAGRQRGEVLCRREADPPVRRGFDLPAGGRRTLIVRLPGPGRWYSARIAGSDAWGAGAFAARRRSAVRQVAMIGRDDPLVRRFVRVNPALRLVGDAADADVVIAVGAAAPPGRPALLIDPPAPPPGWRAVPLTAVALRDADVLADHPLLAHVDLTDVAVRRAGCWQAVGVPAQQRLVGLGANALLLAGRTPPRVYLGFDLAPENTNFAMTEAFVIFLANAVDYLAPGAAARESYEHLSPLQAGPRGDWERLPTPDEPGAPSTGVLPAPGVYRDPAGALHAVSLVGLRSAEPKTDPQEQIAAISLPPPLPASEGVEFWPMLAAAAVVVWMVGWTLRLR